MKLLITGGCGFLGTNLALCALERGDELSLLDNLSRHGSADNLAWLRQRAGSRFVFTHCDTRHAKDVERAVETFLPDVVYHLAGQVAMTTSIENPRVDFETNALGTFNVLEALRRAMPSARFIFSSTNKVYGDLSHVRFAQTETRYIAPDFSEGFDEQLLFSPCTPYGVSKAAADTLVREYHRSYGLRTVVLRHSSMYGGRQFATFDQGWVGWFCDRALRVARGEIDSFTIAGNGKQVRDVLHSSDLMRLYFQLADQIDSIAGKVFNVGGGMQNSLSLVELFALLEELLGVRLRYELTPWRDSDQKVFVSDNGRVCSAVGWTPETTARQGVAMVLKELRERQEV
ncbi:MAG: GDP-mannose 4,6-dehydratase [Myxococcota bacterium]|jgi:CDP-paratose 2-epimerase|nr:GDP-mannose 4,6-dehydratase [Myxococcota bacterium]